jgi:hypothetical protein
MKKKILIIFSYVLMNLFAIGSKVMAETITQARKIEGSDLTVNYPLMTGNDLYQLKLKNVTQRVVTLGFPEAMGWTTTSHDNVELVTLQCGEEVVYEYDIGVDKLAVDAFDRRIHGKMGGDCNGNRAHENGGDNNQEDNTFNIDLSLGELVLLPPEGGTGVGVLYPVEDGEVLLSQVNFFHNASYEISHGVNSSRPAKVRWAAFIPDDNEIEFEFRNADVSRSDALAAMAMTMSQPEGFSIKYTDVYTENVFFMGEQTGLYYIDALVKGERNSISASTYNGIAKINVIDMQIVSAIDVILGDAKADVPFVIELSSDTEITVDDITEINARLVTEEREVVLNVDKNDDLYAGNIMDDTESENPMFTIVIDWESLSIPRLSVTDINKVSTNKAKIIVDLKIDYDGTNIALEVVHDLDAFADMRLTCVEIGIDEEWEELWFDPISGNGVAGHQRFDNGENEYTDFQLNELPEFMHAQHLQKGWDQEGFEFGYHIRADLQDGFLVGVDGPSGIIYRSGIFDRKEGFYYVIYYGRQKISDEDRWIVDPSKDSGRYEVSAWGNESKFDCYVQSSSSETGDYPGLAISVVGIARSISSWNVIDFGISLAGALYSAWGFLNVDESAAIYITNYLVTNNPEGEPMGNPDVSSITGINGFSWAGSKSLTFQDEDTGLFSMNNNHAEAFELVYGYQSVTIVINDESTLVTPTHVAAEAKFSPENKKVNVEWVE